MIDVVKLNAELEALPTADLIEQWQLKAVSGTRANLISDILLQRADAGDETALNWFKN